MNKSTHTSVIPEANPPGIGTMARGGPPVLRARLAPASWGDRAAGVDQVDRMDRIRLFSPLPFPRVVWKKGEKEENVPMRSTRSNLPYRSASAAASRSRTDRSRRP